MKGSIIEYSGKLMSEIGSTTDKEEKKKLETLLDLLKQHEPQIRTSRAYSPEEIVNEKYDAMIEAQQMKVISDELAKILGPIHSKHTTAGTNSIFIKALGKKYRDWSGIKLGGKKKKKKTTDQKTES